MHSYGIVCILIPPKIAILYFLGQTMFKSTNVNFLLYLVYYINFIGCISHDKITFNPCKVSLNYIKSCYHNIWDLFYVATHQMVFFKQSHNYYATIDQAKQH